jgi:hypothetical protein
MRSTFLDKPSNIFLYQLFHKGIYDSPQKHLKNASKACRKRMSPWKRACKNGRRWVKWTSSPRMDVVTRRARVWGWIFIEFESCKKARRTYKETLPAHNNRCFSFHQKSFPGLRFCGQVGTQQLCESAGGLSGAVWHIIFAHTSS